MDFVLTTKIITMTLRKKNVVALTKIFSLGPVRFCLFQQNIPTGRPFHGESFFCQNLGSDGKKKRTPCLNPSEYCWSEHSVVTKIRNGRSFVPDQKTFMD